MLVLTRKSGQKLIINSDIVITVLETRGDTVKIGIEAPKTVAIYREEIFAEILSANREASEGGAKTDASSLDKAMRLMKPPGKHT